MRKKDKNLKMLSRAIKRAYKMIMYMYLQKSRAFQFFVHVPMGNGSTSQWT